MHYDKQVSNLCSIYYHCWCVDMGNIVMHWSPYLHFFVNFVKLMFGITTYNICQEIDDPEFIT